jgi:hypothetical protein
MCDQIRSILNKLFETSSNVYLVSNKRQQDTTENNDNQTLPPTKQMRIERFAKKPVRYYENIYSIQKSFILVTIF